MTVSTQDANTNAQTHVFEAEVSQLLDLVANALYSDKEIFVRELVSNASDAADKLRYEALSDSGLYEDDSDLKIWISFNKEHSTLTIRDNGIGMSMEDVVSNLGTIAKSGTRAFKEMLTGDNAKDSQLIGQFGVGFYSAFIVADNVIVKTRRAGMSPEQGVEWESSGKGEYTVKHINKSQRGSEIILHIKDSQQEFLDDHRLRTVIRKYSDHILLPICMPAIETEDDKKKKEKGEIIIAEDEVVNQANALWTLSKSEISDEQYQDLYKHISHDFENPLSWAHNKVEGSLEYTSLLYIPARAPFDLWDREHKRGLKLYVKRVFIMDDADHFMPMYMRFVKGIVDSNDLPLNISRELLQSDMSTDKIRSGLVKRMLSTLEKMANNDVEQYAKFWKEFGQVLKEGPGEDHANKDRISKLLRFKSTHNDSEVEDVTLASYVERMSDKQNHIYYVTADTFAAAKNSPLLEVFLKKNIEVLLLTDRVDEWLVSHLTEFDGKTLKSVSQGALDLGDLEDEATKDQQKKEEKAFKNTVAAIKKALGDKVEDVRMTHRLTDSPSCVVYGEQGMTGHMQRIMQAAGQAFPASKPILELNPTHAVMLKIKEGNDDSNLELWSDVLLSQALLAEGEALSDPSEFVKQLNKLLLS